MLVASRPARPSRLDELGGGQRTPFPATFCSGNGRCCFQLSSCMCSARDAAARPPSCRRQARSSSPCRRPIAARLGGSPIVSIRVGAVRLSTACEAANDGWACRCAPACSREHHSARSGVAAGSPDGLRVPCALSCAWTGPWTLFEKRCAAGMWAAAACRSCGFRACQWP